MKKNAFTLIEVLAVISVLAIITLITSISVIRILNDSREKLYKNQIGIIQEQAKKWNVDNPNSTLSCVSISTLQSSGYLEDKDIEDPRNKGSKISGGVKITYSSTYNQYVYEYTDSCN